MKMRRKVDLPGKTCVTCGYPFVWRKKWTKVWDEFRHCLEECRRAGHQLCRTTAICTHCTCLDACIPYRY